MIIHQLDFKFSGHFWTRFIRSAQAVWSRSTQGLGFIRSRHHRRTVYVWVSVFVATVDGSEIRTTTVWMVLKPVVDNGDKLPTNLNWCRPVMGINYLSLNWCFQFALNNQQGRDVSQICRNLLEDGRKTSMFQSERKYMLVI